MIPRIKMQLPWKVLESGELNSVHFKYVNRNEFPETGSIDKVIVNPQSAKFRIYKIGSELSFLTFSVKNFREPIVLSSGLILIEGKYTIVVAGREKECFGGEFILIFTNPDNPIISTFLPVPGIWG